MLFCLGLTPTAASLDCLGRQTVKKAAKMACKGLGGPEESRRGRARGKRAHEGSA